MFEICQYLFSCCCCLYLLECLHFHSRLSLAESTPSFSTISSWNLFIWYSSPLSVRSIFFSSSPRFILFLYHLLIFLEVGMASLQVIPPSVLLPFVQAHLNLWRMYNISMTTLLLLCWRKIEYKILCRPPFRVLQNKTILSRLSSPRLTSSVIMLKCNLDGDTLLKVLLDAKTPAFSNAQVRHWETFVYFIWCEFWGAFGQTKLVNIYSILFVLYSSWTSIGRMYFKKYQTAYEVSMKLKLFCHRKQTTVYIYHFWMYMSHLALGDVLLFQNLFKWHS